VHYVPTDKINASIRIRHVTNYEFWPASSHY